MKNKYFKDCKTLDELRQVYKELLKKYHPDNGGDVAICQEINAEYKKVFEILKNKKSSSEEQEPQNSKKWDETADELLREQIFNFIHFEDLNIEIIGCWIWIDGTTFPHKDFLKEKGFKWSKNRKKWHWTSEPATEHRYFKGKKSFEEIRNKYGSEHIQKVSTFKLA